MQLLIVEDEAGIRDVLGELLTCAGYETYVAGGVADALAALNQREFYLVVLDIALPDGDGAEVVRFLRARGQTTPVLVCTGLADEGLTETLLDLGADGVIEKPFSCRELLARVRALLRRTAPATQWQLLEMAG